MKLVVDCSVTMAWLLPDERPLMAIRALEHIVEYGAVCPALWRSEVGNSLLMAVRRKRLVQQQRTAIIACLEDLPIEYDHQYEGQLWHYTLALAERHQLSLYDASYVEVAQRHCLPLASFDEALLRSAEKEKIEVWRG